jgi:hypothetical protein
MLSLARRSAAAAAKAAPAARCNSTAAASSAAGELQQSGSVQDLLAGNATARNGVGASLSTL